MMKHDVVVTMTSGKQHIIQFSLMEVATYGDFVNNVLAAPVFHTPEGTAIITAHIESLDWARG